jgi:hypothetical protein
MADHQIHPRASRFSKIMREWQGRTPKLTDIDGVRSPDLFSREIMLIEQRTGGYGGEQGAYTRDAVMQFARVLSLQPHTAPTFDRRLDENTQQRLWLQFAYPARTFSQKMSFRLIAVVGNVYDEDVREEHRHFKGRSVLPAEWSALWQACKQASVYAHVVNMEDGRVSRADEVLLCSSIVPAGREAVFL